MTRTIKQISPLTRVQIKENTRDDDDTLFETGLEEVHSYTGWRVREALGKKNVPENEKWRLGLLTTLLKMKMDKFTQVQDSKQLCAMIDSLSST